jgi:hypothetical protein
MGVKTLYEYFYKLAYGDKGADKATLFNDCLDVADAEIKANKDARHTQGTDQGLDTGGANAVVVADVKDAVTKKHTQGTDTDLNSTFEATFVKKVDTVNVLSDITSVGADIEDAVTKKHTQNTDTDLDATFEANFAKKADKLSVFAATTSAELAGVISDETGTDKLVYNTSPTIFLPVIKGTTASDLPTYSAEFLDADGWTSTGWTGDWATGWTHTTGNTTALSHDHTAVNATKYQIAYTVSGWTAGTFTVAFGGQSLVDISTTGAFGPTTTSTAVLTITPTTNFDGKIVISIKSITAISTALASYQSSEGTVRTEIRATTAPFSIFIGREAGAYNTTGYFNTAIGMYALRYNTTGYNNTAIGTESLYENTTGNYNTAVGANTFWKNTTGGYNAAMGAEALAENTTGNYNAAMGVEALRYNTTGSFNTAMGQNTLFSNTIGEQNSALGTGALGLNTEGNYNTAVGMYALRCNTTGGYNTVIGKSALFNNITGSNNVVVGYHAGYYETNSDTFYVDNQDRTNTDGDKTKALLYGVFNAIASSQTLTTNSAFTARKITVQGDISSRYYFYTDDSNPGNRNWIIATGHSAYGDFVIRQSNAILGDPWGGTGTSRLYIKETGQVAIGGGESPSALLHLAAGTATASTAPLKFTSGTVNTTPETGAVEYNGTSLFFTRTGTVRETIGTVLTKTDTGDPTGAEGLFCINTYDNTFKVYADGGWRSLATW